jgi:hypothetical protein
MVYEATHARVSTGGQECPNMPESGLGILRVERHAYAKVPR